MKKEIIVMTKVPFQGIIKNRLSKEIGFVKSKRLTCLNLENIKKIFLFKREEYIIKWYITPFYKFRSYSFSFCKNCIYQVKGNLGKKMWHLVNKQNKPFVIVGSDIPNLNRKYISLAFHRLKTTDIVLGPTYDGGFWLIGFSNKKKIVYPFYDIRWSTKDTLKDLIKNLQSNNIKFKFTKKLRDIDNKRDYCENIKD